MFCFFKKIPCPTGTVKLSLKLKQMIHSTTRGGTDRISQLDETACEMNESEEQVSSMVQKPGTEEALLEGATGERGASFPQIASAWAKLNALGKPMNQAITYLTKVPTPLTLWACRFRIIRLDYRSSSGASQRSQLPSQDATLGGDLRMRRIQSGE